MTPEQAAEKYHWIKYDSATNTIELYLDHHVLSTARLCESKFVMEHLLHIKPDYRKVEMVPDEEPEQGNTRLFMPAPVATKTVKVETRKPWFLDFGEYIHYMTELFYLSFIHREKFDNTDFALSKEQQCLNAVEFLKIGKKIWELMDMDWYKDKDKKYTDVGGWEGVSALLLQYYVYYMDLRVRVVDTEIVFGYNKEVPIGSFTLAQPYIVACYLTGRIDLLIDNGSKLGPVDHKTTHVFRGDESEHFNPQDAICGYILAARSLLKQNYPKYFEQGRECLSAWVYHISACTPSKNKKTGLIGPRFKTTPISKTLSQLEDFKARQLSTYKRIAEILFNNKVPEWNTLTCDNIFMRPCEYKLIHRSPSEEWKHIITQSYVVGEPWNPRLRDSDKIKLTDINEKK